MPEPIVSNTPPEGYGMPCPEALKSLIANIFSLPQYDYNSLYNERVTANYSNVSVGDLYLVAAYTSDLVSLNGANNISWYDINDIQLVMRYPEGGDATDLIQVYSEQLSPRLGIPLTNLKPNTRETELIDAKMPGFFAHFWSSDFYARGCAGFSLSEDRETREYIQGAIIPAVRVTYSVYYIAGDRTDDIDALITISSLVGCANSISKYTAIGATNDYYGVFKTYIAKSDLQSQIYEGRNQVKSYSVSPFYIGFNGDAPSNGPYNYVTTPNGFYSGFPNVILADSALDFKSFPQLSDRQLELLRQEASDVLDTETPSGPDTPDNPNLGDLPDGSTEVNDSATGLYSRYLVSPGTLVTLSDWLWTTGLEIFEAFTNFLYGKPIDTVISLVSYPFNVGSLLGSAVSTVKFGNNNTGVAANLLTENSAQINWGTISLASINRNQNFLDMAPYTQLKLYLPWGTGFVDIDPSDVIDIDKTNGVFLGGTLGVISNFEVAKGTVVHNVVNGNGVVIGSYSTNVGRQIAVVGNDYAAKQIQVIAGVVGLAALTAVAGTAGMTAGMSAAFTPQTFAAGTSAAQSSISAGLREGFRTAGSVVSSRAGRRVAMASTAAIATAPMNVYRSGAFTEGSAGMGIQYPYLLVSQPKADIPQNYGSYYGYPCNKFVTLGSLSGYTEVGSVHLDGIPATESEMNELERIIQGGIIL